MLMPEESRILLTNIQRFSLHDGPGIRTTVFLKGCSLRCPWCSNPENLNPRPEPYMKDGVPGIYGRYMNCDEIFYEIMKDKDFFDSDNSDKHKKSLDSLPGGVTFSGGEPLLQAYKIRFLLQRLKENNIHMAMETCLFASTDKLELAMKYIDLFYVDMKIMDKRLCRKVEHGDLDLYLKNIDILLDSGISAVIRIPVIGGYTDGEANRKAIVELLSIHRPIKVELIEEHKLGLSKYTSLALPIPNYQGIRKGLMEEYKAEVEKVGVPVEICKV